MAEIAGGVNLAISAVDGETRLVWSCAAPWFTPTISASAARARSETRSGITSARDRTQEGDHALEDGGKEKSLPRLGQRTFHTDRRMDQPEPTVSTMMTPNQLGFEASCITTERDRNGEDDHFAIASIRQPSHEIHHH